MQAQLSACVTPPLLPALLCAQIISAHPALLSYSVPDRLQPFFAYLTGELGLSQQVGRQPAGLQGGSFRCGQACVTTVQTVSQALATGTRCNLL